MAMATPPQRESPSPKLKTIILDGGRLIEARSILKNGNDAVLQKSLQVLTSKAEAWLTQGPWSVMEKTKAPPSGDMHDYTSQAPYWWPSPTPDGKPYVQRDGERNPEVLNYSDRVNVEKVFGSSSALALAWFYTGKEEYGRHAAAIIRTWFISPTTRMNPNLNHAQLIPYANTGRHIGIIDFSQWYTTLLDVAVILNSGSPSGGSAPGWEAEDMDRFREWNRDFLQWLTESEFGKAERAEKNNHGSFTSMLISAIALFVDNIELVKVEAASIQNDINDTIRPDGALPEELRRTRSWHYSNFTLLALTRLAMVANKAGVDLWNYRGPQGQGITKAIEYIIPTATGDAAWPYEEFQFERYAAADVIRAAADAGHEQSRQAISKIETPVEDLWPLRPAPEQLEPVKVNPKHLSK
ncbi:chondroitin AC/alginate lyase [Trichoderma chlorosporum]